MLRILESRKALSATHPPVYPASPLPASVDLPAPRSTWNNSTNRSAQQAPAPLGAFEPAATLESRPVERPVATYRPSTNRRLLKPLIVIGTPPPAPSASRVWRSVPFVTRTIRSRHTFRPLPIYTAAQAPKTPAVYPSFVPPEPIRRQSPRRFVDPAPLPDTPAAAPKVADVVSATLLRVNKVRFERRLLKPQPLDEHPQPAPIFAPVSAFTPVRRVNKRTSAAPVVELVSVILDNRTGGTALYPSFVPPPTLIKHKPRKHLRLPRLDEYPLAPIEEAPEPAYRAPKRFYTAFKRVRQVVTPVAPYLRQKGPHPSYERVTALKRRDLARRLLKPAQLDRFPPFVEPAVPESALVRPVVQRVKGLGRTFLRVVQSIYTGYPSEGAEAAVYVRSRFHRGPAYLQGDIQILVYTEGEIREEALVLTNIREHTSYNEGDMTNAVYLQTDFNV